MEPSTDTIPLQRDVFEDDQDNETDFLTSSPPPKGSNNHNHNHNMFPFKVMKTVDGTSGSFDSDDENIDTYERSDTVNEIPVTDVDDFVVHYGEVKRKSDFSGALFNMINSIIGAGIVGIPYAIMQSGLWAGLILLCLVAFLTDYSILLLVRTGLLSKERTYIDIMEKCFGKVGRYLLSSFQFLFPFGGMCAYMIIIGDTLSPLLTYMTEGTNAQILGNRYLLISLTSVLIIFPLCMIRSLSKLSRFSFVSIVAVLYIILAVSIRGIQMKRPKAENYLDFAHGDVMKSIGVMTHAFVCHHNTMIIFESMKKPNLKSFGHITHISISFCLVVSAILGAMGYISFTDSTASDILSEHNFARNDIAINIARYFYAFSIMLTYPIECFVCREVILETFFPKKQFTWLRHTLITLGLVATSFAVSMSTDNLGIILELNGSFSASTLAFVFPPLCFLKLSNQKLLSFPKISSILLLVFGCGIVVASTSMSIISLIF